MKRRFAIVFMMSLLGAALTPLPSQAETSLLSAREKQLTSLLAPLLDQGDFGAVIPLQLELFQLAQGRLGADDPEMAELQHVLGEMYRITGQLDQAFEWHQRALAIRERVLGPDHAATAASLNSLAIVHYSQGRYDPALTLLQRGLAIHHKLPGQHHEDTATSLGNLGIVYQAMGRHEKALPLYRQALSLQLKALGPTHAKTAITMSNLAAVYEKTGKYDDALSLYQKASEIFDRSLGPMHPYTASGLNNLAELYTRINRYDKALPLYKRALQIREKAQGPVHPDTAIALSNLASLYHVLGSYDQALALYRRALAVREQVLGPDHPDTAVTIGNLAVLYDTLGNQAEALPLLRRVLTLRERILGPDSVETVAAMGNLASAYFAAGLYDKAHALQRRATAMNEDVRGPYHGETAQSLTNLALTYQSARQDDMVLPTLAHALHAASAANVPIVTKHVYASIGNYYASQGNLATAILFHKKAVNTMQQLRTGTRSMSENLRKSFLKKNENTYKQLAALLIDTGRLNEAQQVLSMLKEDEYHDFIRRDARADQRTTRAGYSGAEHFWAARLDGLSEATGKLAPQWKGMDAAAKNLWSATQQREQAAIRQQLDQFGQQTLAEISSMAVALPAEQAGLAEKERIGREALIAETQKRIGSMGNGTMLVSYLLLGDKIRIVLTGPDGQIAREAPIGETDLYPKLVAFRKMLEDPKSDPQPLAAELYRLLIKPVEADLTNAQTVMLSLDGALRYIPFAALHDGERYLVQRYKLALYTSAASGKMNVPAKTQWNVAGLGVSRAVGGFTALPAVRQELAGIIGSGGLHGESFLDSAFTADRMKDSLKRNFSVMHIASHFQFAPGTEADSFLLLGDGTRLSLQEIRQGDYRFDGLDLLTLSACATAMDGGRGADGRDVEGLGVLAQRKGAKSVIASLWPIADGSTATLMQVMYRAKSRQHLDKAAALQQAQRALLEGRTELVSDDTRRRTLRPDREIAKTGDPASENLKIHAHPFYWAPFVLMGSWL